MKKPTAGFASGGGLETLLVLLAVSALAGSARSLDLNNRSGHGNSGHRSLRDQRGALRDGSRQTHEERIPRAVAHASRNASVTRFVTRLLTLLSAAAPILSTKMPVISFLSTDVDERTVRNAQNRAHAPYSEGCTSLTTRRLAT